MRPRRHRSPHRIGLRFLALMAALLASWGLDAQAQTCLPIPLEGLPGTVLAGETVSLSAELTTNCNFKIVDAATLVCHFSDGQEIRQSLSLMPSPGLTRAEAEVVIPDISQAVTGECFVEFTQCNQQVRTCGQALATTSWNRDRAPVRAPEPRPSTVSRPSPSGGARSGPPPPSVASQSRGGGLGTFLKGLGWVGVAVGLASYADASSKEEEGLTAEADESEALGNEILVASSLLLVLGYSTDAKGFAPNDDGPPRRRFQPMLAVDPVHRAVAVQVRFTFD